jgi:hypothetical protein
MRTATRSSKMRQVAVSRASCHTLPVGRSTISTWRRLTPTGLLSGKHAQAVTAGVQVNSLYNGHLSEEALSIALYAAAFTVFTITLLSFLLSLRRQSADGAPCFGTAPTISNTDDSTNPLAAISHANTSAANSAAEELLGEESRVAAINAA